MPAWYYLIYVFIVLDFIVVFFVLKKRRRSHQFEPSELAYLHSHWQKIVGDRSYDAKHAILDADKLLDYALNAKGFKGPLGEKLKGAKDRFSDLNGVWEAHKLRNKIAHEMIDLEDGQVKQALSRFRRALNDLGAGL